MKIEIEIGEIDTTKVEENVLLLAVRMEQLIHQKTGDFNDLMSELVKVILQLKEYKKLYDEGSR